MFTGTYNVNEQPDTLINVLKTLTDQASLPLTASIGKFKGPAETDIQLKYKSSGIFVFVLEGAFEIEGRLLHGGDALAVWDVNSIELEALSNDAIILVVDAPGKSSL